MLNVIYMFCKDRSSGGLVSELHLGVMVGVGANCSLLVFSRDFRAVIDIYLRRLQKKKNASDRKVC